MTRREQEQQILKPLYLKGGRDLKGVETLVQLYGTRDYLRSIGIEPRYIIIVDNIWAEVTEDLAITEIKSYEKIKEKESRED